MSSISVKWQIADSALDQYSDHRFELSGAAAAVRSVKSYRCMRGREFGEAYRALDRIVARLEDEKNDIRSLESGLSAVLRTYRGCEKGLSETQEKSSDAGGGNIFWDIISQIGIIGPAISAIGKTITEKWDGKTICSILKDILKVVGDVVKVKADGADAEWAKALFGWVDGLKDLDTSSPGKTFDSFFKKQVDDLFWDTNAKPVKKFEVSTKWGDLLLTAVSNLFENIDEFKGQTGAGGRMVAETAIETALDIAVGKAVEATVTTVAAALVTAGVFTGATAAAIGIVTVIAVWAIDGSGVVEGISDFICNKAETVTECIGAVVQWGEALFGF